MARKTNSVFIDLKKKKKKKKTNKKPQLRGVSSDHGEMFTFFPSEISLSDDFI